MKKIRYSVYALLAIVFSLVLNSFVAVADVGNTNDYSSNWDSDWDSGYDSDWGSDYDSDWGSDYNYGYNSGYNNYGSSSGGGDGISFGTIIFVIIIIIIIMRSKNNGGGTGGSSGGTTSTTPKQMYNVNPNLKVPNNTDEITSAIISIDENFSKDKFLAWSKEVFITLQNAWTERDWAKIRPFEKEELFKQHERLLQEYINNGTINVIERINISQAYFFKYSRDAEYEYLTVFMDVRMADYIKDEKTNAVVKGDPNTDCFLKYLLTFTRKTGVKTDSARSNCSTVSCPNCGAPTQITSAGKCEYCESIITTGDYDWVLVSLDGVKNNTDLSGEAIIIKE